MRDYGRGIPLGKVVDCVSQMNTGGKFDSDAFQFSAGMNGVGLKAVNALSAFFEVRSFREGEFSEAVSRRTPQVAEAREAEDRRARRHVHPLPAGREASSSASRCARSTSSAA